MYDPLTSDLAIFSTLTDHGPFISRTHGAVVELEYGLFKYLGEMKHVYFVPYLTKIFLKCSNLLNFSPLNKLIKEVYYRKHKKSRLQREIDRSKKLKEWSII